MLSASLAPTGTPRSETGPPPPALAACFERLAALHSRCCPRQVLGVRMGLQAAALLELDVPRTDKRLFTVIETDGCLADGVSVATGCWLGRRTLRLIDYGKVAATVVDTQTERAVRVWPHPLARTRAAAYAPGAPTRWHAQLEGYAKMPTAELLLADPVALTVSLAAIIARPGERVTCASCDEEIINQREVLVDGRPLCRGCARTAYHARFDLADPRKATGNTGLFSSGPGDSAGRNDPPSIDRRPAWVWRI